MEQLLGLKEFLTTNYPAVSRGKFSATQLQEIKTRLSSGEIVKSIAIDMNVSRGTIYNIKNEITYKE